MLKLLLSFLNYFLSKYILENSNIALLYRARIIVACSLIGIFAAILALFTVFFANLSPFICISVALCILILLGKLYFLKKLTHNFEKNMLIGSTVQVSVITGLIYLSAFAKGGAGFFGLVWLIPIFLMMAFYFEWFFSLIYTALNIALLILVTSFKYKTFFDPINYIPHFSIVFLSFLMLVILFSYSLSFISVRLNEDLQKEIAKQRDILIESAKFQSLGQMASNLAHDINNPLFTIQGKLHQMRNLLSRDQLDLDKCDQIVENVEATILKLSQIVKGISTFARQGSNDEMVLINAKELLDSTLALGIDRIKNSGIGFEINVSPNLSIICFPSFISQVILNLVNNAIDAVENVNVKKIEISCFKENEWVTIIVSDSGLGVSKENETKIFDQFFTTKTIGKGTGLGLSISKGLIEIHEGELKYERVNQKSNFVIKLPSYE